MFLKGFIVVLCSDHQTLADFLQTSQLFSTLDMPAKIFIYLAKQFSFYFKTLLHFLQVSKTFMLLKGLIVVLLQLPTSQRHIKTSPALFNFRYVRTKSVKLLFYAAKRSSLKLKFCQTTFTIFASNFCPFPTLGLCITKLFMVINNSMP
jgi:hypothetical protein